MNFRLPGLNQLFINHWTGLFVPAGTPQEAVKVQASANEQILKSKNYLAKVEDLGCTVKYLTPAEYAKFLAEEDKVASIVAKQIKLEKK